jgi:hypothetical protein
MRAAVFTICALLALPALEGRDVLRIRVSPATVVAPGFFTVRVNIEADAGNRRLRVVAESPDFFRSSEIQLDGANASPLSVFEFRDLPTGLYEVTGTLVGTDGPRATVSQLARVQPSPGH